MIPAGAEVGPRPVEAVADDDVVATLRRLAYRYPPELAAAQVEDVPRMAFHIALVRTAPRGGGVRSWRRIRSSRRCGARMPPCSWRISRIVSGTDPIDLHSTGLTASMSGSTM